MSLEVTNDTVEMTLNMGNVIGREVFVASREKKKYFPEKKLNAQLPTCKHPRHLVSPCALEVTKASLK